MLLEARQVGRTKRYNVLETELVYTHTILGLSQLLNPITIKSSSFYQQV